MAGQADKPAGPRVLVVEDEPIVAADLRQTLDRLGYHVLGTAPDEKQAVHLAGSLRPDVVLMDIRLSGGVGSIAGAGEIRRLYQIPVVFVTEGSTVEPVSRGESAGLSGCVTKPFRANDIHAAIVIALDRHRRSREIFAENTWLRTLLENLRDAVIATDAAGCVRYLNPAAESMTGWTLDEALGRAAEEVYRVTTIDGLPVEHCHIRKSLQSVTPVGKERFLLHSREGRCFTIEDTAAPIFDGDVLAGAAAVFLDITGCVSGEREQLRKTGQPAERHHPSALAVGDTRGEMRELCACLMAAHEEERRGIARELHDDIGQRAALLEFDLERLRSRIAGVPGAPALEGLDALSQRIAGLSEALRSVSHRLHPSIVADLGIEAALKSLAEDYRRQGMDIAVAMHGVPARLPQSVGIALYRIAQEGLTNASRHAPGAPVRLTLSGAGPELQLSIEDAGPGFDLNEVRGNGSIGLLSMQERARLIGGALLLATGRDEGTSVLVRLPRP